MSENPKVSVSSVVGGGHAPIPTRLANRIAPSPSKRGNLMKNTTVVMATFVVVLSLSLYLFALLTVGTFMPTAEGPTITIHARIFESGGINDGKPITTDDNGNTIKAGTSYQLKIIAVDTAHAFVIKGPEGFYETTSIIQGGQSEVLEVTFPTAGEYTISCALYCSVGHFSMTGRIVVE